MSRSLTPMAFVVIISTLVGCIHALPVGQAYSPNCEESETICNVPPPVIAGSVAWLNKFLLEYEQARKEYMRARD